MEPRIWVDHFHHPSDEEGPSPEMYIASYIDEHNERVDGQGPTEEQALEDLYKKLERQGFALSELPPPT